VDVILSKIVALKGAIRKCLNDVAAHTEGLRDLPICFLAHFFRVNVPLTMFAKEMMKKMITIITLDKNFATKYPMW
jgi:hypothetical protein